MISFLLVLCFRPYSSSGQVLRFFWFSLSCLAIVSSWCLPFSCDCLFVWSASILLRSSTISLSRASTSDVVVSSCAIFLCDFFRYRDILSCKGSSCLFHGSLVFSVPFIARFKCCFDGRLCIWVSSRECCLLSISLLVFVWCS